jgi:hypothetical protein
LIVMFEGAIMAISMIEKKRGDPFRTTPPPEENNPFDGKSR